MPLERYLCTSPDAGQVLRPLWGARLLRTGPAGVLHSTGVFCCCSALRYSGIAPGSAPAQVVPHCDCLHSSRRTSFSCPLPPELLRDLDFFFFFFTSPASVSASFLLSGSPSSHPPSLPAVLIDCSCDTPPTALHRIAPHCTALLCPPAQFSSAQFVRPAPSRGPWAALVGVKLATCGLIRSKGQTSRHD